MNKSDVLDAIREILRKDLQRTEPIGLETDLLSELQLGSIELLTLAIGLENQFEICLEPEDEAHLTNVAALIDRVLVLSESRADSTLEG